MTSSSTLGPRIYCRNARLGPANAQISRLRETLEIDSQIAALTIGRQLSLIGPKGYLQRLQRLHALLTADPDDSEVGEEMLVHVR